MAEKHHCISLGPHTTDETAEGQQQRCHPYTTVHMKQVVVSGLQWQLWPHVYQHLGVTRGLAPLSFNDEFTRCVWIFWLMIGMDTA